MNKVILHIDMNSYFASVEQQANPFLRGKPVGVCAYLSPNGCVIASSLEAKKFGVKTGMRAREAKAICPDIILLENEPAKYRSVTEKIFAILADYSDRIEHYSIDEAFVDLTAPSPVLRTSSPQWGEENKFPLAPLGERARVMVERFQHAYAIALAIKARINTEVGEYLKCSIGISYTRWLAKFASDVAEKNSILILAQENLESIYARVMLTDAWGIGSRIARRLELLGIHTLNDLKKYPPANLLQSLGKYGYYLWANVNGIETCKSVQENIQAVSAAEKQNPQSIGHSYCVPNKTKDLKYLRAILMKLCEKTGQRLRQKCLEARSIYAMASYMRGGGVYHSHKVQDPLYDTVSIYHETDKILFSYPLADRVRMLAVSVSSLAPETNQLSFLSDTIKNKRLSQALDRINDKFGNFTIASGEMFGTERIAQDRIGFRKVEIY